MKRKRVKLSSWSKGRRCMKLLANRLHSKIEEDGEYMYLQTAEVKISCFFDPRETSFIVIKYSTEKLPQLIELILDDFI